MTLQTVMAVGLMSLSPAYLALAAWKLWRKRR